MSKKILVDMERQRHLFSGLGYYCHCLEQGLRTIDTEQVINYYRPFQENEVKRQTIKRFSPLHRLYNSSPRGFKLLHITTQDQKYFLRRAKTDKLIVTLHDLNFLHENLSEGQRARRLSLVRQNLNQADVIVCISDYVREDLERNRHLFKLKPEVKITRIYNGIIFDESPIQNFDEKPQFSFVQKHKFLLSIGVLTDKKKQLQLIKALAFLPEDYHLALAFASKKEDYFAELEQTISELALSERVHFLEKVSAEEKRYLLLRAEALVHPSIAEGFGIPPIEAMALGRPVFLNKATSLPEIGGEEAYYFSDIQEPKMMAKEILMRLQAYHSDEKKKAQALRTWAKSYDYRVMSRNYYELYLTLVQ